MKNIPSNKLASFVPTKVRQYVESLCIELIEDNIHPLVQENQVLNQKINELTQSINQLNADLKTLKTYVNNDVKYSLTRAKIVGLMKELGIE